MNVPTVTCSVCAKTVNKRSTYHVGNGKRACREHEGIQDQANKAQDTIKEQHEALKKEIERKRNEWKEKTQVYKLTPRCFSCQCEGLHQTDYFMQLLIRHELFFKLHGKHLNFLDNKELEQAYEGLPICLWVIPYNEKIKVHHTARFAVHAMGLCLLCMGCCQRYHVKPYEPTLKDVDVFSVVYEMGVKPVIEETVEKMIKESSEKIITRLKQEAAEAEDVEN